MDMVGPGNRELGSSNGGGLGGTTVGMEGNDEGRSGVDRDEDSKVTPFRVRGEGEASAKHAPTEEKGNTAVRAKGLQGGVTVLGGPEGLVSPFSSPGCFFVRGAAIGFKEGSDVIRGKSEVGSAEGGVTESADVVEAEGDLAERGRGRVVGVWGAKAGRGFATAQA